MKHSHAERPAAHTRPTRAARCAVALALCASASLVACSSSGGSTPDAGPPLTPTTTTAPSTQAPVQAATPSATTSSAPAATTPAVTGTFTAASGSGIRVKATIRLQRPVSAADASSAWTADGGSGDIPCVTDTQTDGVIVGTLEFDNQTPSYTPDFYVNFNGITTDAPMALGAGYSNGNQCISDGQDAYEGSAIQPTWNGSTWGPVPIAIVIHNYYGPAYPDGNTRSLSTVELVLSSQGSDSYNLDSETGIFSQINGPVMLMDLSELRE